MNTTYRISGFSLWAIIGFALTLDLLQFLLTLTIVGSVAAFYLGTVGGVALWLIFKLHGVKYSGSGALKKISASFGTLGLEMIPFIDALPLITAGAVTVILQTRKEDVEKQKQQEAEELNRTQMLQAQEADWFRAKQAADANKEEAALQAANDGEEEARFAQAA